MLKRASLLAWAIMPILSASAHGQSPRDLVRQAVRTEIAANAADHSRWLFYEVDKKPVDGVVQWVAQTSTGDVSRVLQQNGNSLSASDQRSRMESFIHDSGAEAKQRRSSQHDDRQAAEMMNMLPNAFIWTKTGEQGNSILLHFKPDPNFKPPTWESRVFAAMEGDMAIDKTDHRIVSLKGKMISPVKFGWGIFGALEPGGWFQVERRQVDHGIWQITETHVHIQGHALIFKSISDQEDDVKSRFQQLPSNITLDQAMQRLMAIEK
jgi:hypothetical protein